MNLNLDAWQIKVLKTKGNKAICSGRQVGKSTVISIDAAEFAVKNKKSSILIISSVERQAFELFQKVLFYLQDNYNSYIQKGKNRPTQSVIKLGNGSIIRCLPTGIDGHGIRGFTVHRLYADEAHYIDEDVWAAVTPMLTTTGGDLILLSTPKGNEGFFHEMYEDESFTSFHISTEEVVRDRPISNTWTQHQREKALEHLAREKRIKSELVYAQEYLGQFVGGLMQFFPTDLIKSCATITLTTGEGHISIPSKVLPSGETYLGIDIARMGQDETVLASMLRINRERLHMIDMEITRKTLLTDTVRLVIQKDITYGYSRIYIDDGGLGVGVFDPLLENDQTKRKIVGINNASRSISIRKDGKQKGKKLLKEDLYFNLKNLMEKGKVSLFNDINLINSLKSIQYEYTKDGNIRIYGKYSHIAEALIRAVWCMKDKKLNAFIGI